REDEIRMQSDNRFDAGSLRGTDMWFRFRCHRQVAIIGVTSEAIFEPESVYHLGEIGRERNNATHIERDSHVASHFVSCISRVRSSRSGLRIRERKLGRERSRKSRSRQFGRYQRHEAASQPISEQNDLPTSNKKASRKEARPSPHSFSRRVSASTGLAGILTFGVARTRRAGIADHSGGTVADFHGLPHSPSRLSCLGKCRFAPRSCQSHFNEERRLAVLPQRRA